VGVTLRAIDPGFRGRRLIWGRRLRRSITRLRRSLAIQVPHLYALEQVFDRSVLMLQARFPHVPANKIAEATALWVAAEARGELILREMCSEWLDTIVATQSAEAGSAPNSTLVAQPA
jgi:hypothetical protein